MHITDLLVTTGDSGGGAQEVEHGGLIPGCTFKVRFVHFGSNFNLKVSSISGFFIAQCLASKCLQIN